MTRLLPVALVVLFVVGAIGFITVGRLQDEASQIVDRTLPRLSTSGQINSDQAENFVHVLLAITTDDPRERAAYSEEVEKLIQEVTGDIARYRETLGTNDDVRLVDELERTRERYHAVRRQALELCDRGQKTEALALIKSSLWPAYKAYTVAGDQMFDLAINNGKAQGQRIMKVCSATRLAVAAIGIVIFIGGFVSSFVVMYVIGAFGSAQFKKST